MTPLRRPETDADAAFRFALFRASRPPAESLPGLDPALAGTLLRHQFAGQEASHRAAFPAARREIVEVAGVPVGALVLDEGAEAWRLVDIALLPDWRGRGLGTRLLSEVIARAGAAGLPLRLSVMAQNADAARLYRRLGFVVTGTGDVAVTMELPAPLPGPPAAGAARALRLPDRLRLPLAFDAVALAADLDRLGREAWIAHFVTGNYDGDWSVLPLRAKAGATHPVTMIFSDPTARDFVDTPLLDACPAFRAALARFGCPLASVRLMRLGPGSVIKEHRDHDLAFEDGTVRIHVPVVTNPEVDFRLNGTRVVLDAGSAWYLRLSDPHSVANRGSADRIHLVLDARVDPWIEGLFAEALAGLPRAPAGPA